MITQELIAYVKSELNKGRTREEVRSALLQGGGWGETDISEVFRTIMPLESATIKPVENIAVTPSHSFELSSLYKLQKEEAKQESRKEIRQEASQVDKHPSHFPFKALIVGAMVAVLAFLVYFYRPQVMAFPGKASLAVTSWLGKVTDLINKDEPVLVEEELPKQPAAALGPVNCGTTNSPDRKNPGSYSKDDVLRCLGESAISCADAEGMINDPLFPNIFKISNKDNACRFELAYRQDSTLTDVFGKKLAGRSLGCPLSIVKSIDESDPRASVFRQVSLDNPNKYATDIYFYGTLGLFIENNFDQSKIRSLGCQGSFIDSMIESYNLTQKKK